MKCAGDGASGTDHRGCRDGEVFVADGLRVEDGVVIEDEPSAVDLGVRSSRSV